MIRTPKGNGRSQASGAARNSQPVAVAVVLVAVMDPLNIDRAILAGFDWGVRTANIVAALWPERCRALVSVSGYLMVSQKLGKVLLPPKAELQWWYQYYLATERGSAGHQKYTRLDQAYLPARVAAADIRRCHLRVKCSGPPPSGPFRGRSSQLPLEVRPHGGRGNI
jgi:pimeloyl-ACP methyl ester carboxylesterase